MTADHYVDVSSNNRRGDLGQYVAAGHRKISVKVSEGTGYHWYGGEDLIDEAHRRGLVVEHYHWIRPDVSALEQAKDFVGWAAKRFKHGDSAMSDFELTYENGRPVPDGTDSHRAEQLATFNEYVAARLGKPNTYTGNWYLAMKGPQSQAECRRWPVVMSDYTAGALPNPYHLSYVARQYTDRARVAGWPDPVDYNVMLVPSTLPAPSGGTSHPISTGISTAEAADMYEIIYDQDTRAWYAWSPGFFHHIASSAELGLMANRSLCSNGAAVRKVLATPAKKQGPALQAFGFSNGHVQMVQNFAKKG